MSHLTHTMSALTRRRLLHALGSLPLAALLPAVSLTGACATAQAKPPAPPANEASMEAALRKAALAAEPKATLRVSQTEGPLGLRMVTVFIEGAYPGTGLYSGVLSKGRHFGPYGADLAELARVSDWHTSPPDARGLALLFCRLWRTAEAIAPDTTPTVVRGKDALVLNVELVPALSPDDVQQWRVTLPKVGPWTQGPVEEPAGP